MLSGNAQRHQLVLPEQMVLYDYWRSKCRAGVLPSREDINPADICSLLPHISFTSVVRASSSLRFQIRLAGTGFWKFYSEEIQGSYIDELPIGDRRDYWHRVLTQIAQKNCPSAGVTRAGTPVGGHLYQFWIRLPLAVSANGTSLILGYDHFLRESELSQLEVGSVKKLA